jgi:hypothetical protein
MIDTTVRFLHYEAVDLEAVRMHGAIQRTVSCSNSYSQTRYIINPPLTQQGLSQPRVTVICHDTSVMVLSQVSLPKMLFGSNAKEISRSDLSNAFDIESRLVSALIGRDFDARQALIMRVDYCANFTVGESYMKAYLEAARKSGLARRVRHIYDTGVSFKAKQLETLLYDKGAEIAQSCARIKQDAALPSGTGLLRFEDRFRGKAVTRLTNNLRLENKRALTLLTPEIASLVINKKLAALGLNATVDRDDELLRRLAEKFGKDAPTLYGLLEYRNSFGAKYWTALGISPSTHYRNKKRLVGAGLWVTSGANRTLPGLCYVPTEA